VYPFAQVSISPSVVDATRVTPLPAFSKGILTGGTVSLTYTDHYLNENSPSDVLNPTSAPSLSISVTQYLLNSAGIAVNARFINVAKMNRDASDLAFQTTVTNTVSQVLNAYYALEAADEDVKAKGSAAETATTFPRECQGTGARRISGAFGNHQCRESGHYRPTGSGGLRDHPETAGGSVEEPAEPQRDQPIRSWPARVSCPSIPSAFPNMTTFPAVEDLVKQALGQPHGSGERKEKLKRPRWSATWEPRTESLPFAVVVGSESQAGLAGTARTVNFNGTPVTPNPYFVGGIGTALGQVFRRDFPSESITPVYEMAFRNRQALSDYAIDQLTLRQTQLSNQKDFNQVQVDVQNYVIALRQARARYEAAVRNRTLQEQLYASERRRFELGASIPYNVTQQQRDLMAAQSSEMAALVAYVTARIGLDRTTGAILPANHVSLGEAREGKVLREPAIK
jgi:outer membrane protein